MEGNNKNRDRQPVTRADLDFFKVEILEGVRLILANKGLVQKKWLKSHEVRKLLGVSSGKLQRMRDMGQLPYTAIGCVFYYSEEDIRKLLESRKRQ
ncbi:helix-turn-helix domain-containing protein [Sphingobacterium yanglingense]|uniref:Helix-turn-helix protein n=1 Tax=Sphingobacterium yanglingense TaxID=1437280 RepID=A0A4R6W4Y9_9SPHI|nr:helix-turn-helix domain-containing protein [Sphingobacterium yanglingense]TDQ73798.1 helix-turn-helix protein [Sphingobacterium yanglingense]